MAVATTARSATSSFGKARGTASTPLAPAAPAAPAAVPRTPPSWNIAQPQTARYGGMVAQAQPIAQAKPQQAPNMGLVQGPSAYQPTQYNQAQASQTQLNPQQALASLGNQGFKNDLANVSQYPSNYDFKNLPQEDKFRPNEAAAYWRQRGQAGANQEQMLGSELFKLIGGGQPILQGDVPMLELQMGQQNQMMAEADRQAGYEQLARSYGNIGQAPGEQLAMRSAMGLVNSGGPYNAQYMDQQRGNMRDQSALALQQAQQAMSGDFARRGLGGSLLPFQQAQLNQQSSSALQNNLAGLESQTALANQQAQLAATGQLSEMSYREQAQRQALDQAMANIFLNTERTAPDLSNLVAEMDPAKAKKYVGQYGG
jgi:hypothetical protein